MDTKQKSLLILTVAALGFLGYQVFQLVDRDITETPVIAEQTKQASVSHPALPLAMQPHASVAITQSAVIPTVTKLAVPTATQTGSENTMTPQQHAYVNALNSIEIARMHHQLMDEEAAIAMAQQKIALMHKQTEKLVGPEGSIPGTGMMADQSQDGMALSYIDKQNGQWSATLHIKGNYQSVQIGSQLSNGYQVIGIDHQGVTLQKGNKRELVNFDGITPLVALTDTQSHPASLSEQQQMTQTASVVKATHGTVGAEANLLALQLVHQGAEAQAVARQGLQTTPAQPALKTTNPVMPQLEKRFPDGLAYQVSVHDANADEGADDIDNTQLSMDLHLRSMEIMPVMNQPYNTGAYLSQQVQVPQTYHLVGDDSDDNEQQYASEGSDTDASQIQKVALTEEKVLSLPAQYYTIQLLGSANPDMVSQFVSKNALQNLALTLSVGSDNNPWVIALYGVYPSFDAAEEKLVHLPAALRMGGAWIRRVGDVQRVVRGHAEVS